MSNTKDRIESILFDCGTTYQTDYRRRNFEDQTIPRPKFKSKKPREPYLPLKDHYTLSLHMVNVPSYLFHNKKLILTTDPKSIQQPFDKPIDELRETVRKSRPRVVMPPIVSMDDIEDPQSRSILLEDMYTTCTARAQKEAVSFGINVKSPFPGKVAPARPVSLPSYNPPFVSPELRMDSVKWDNNQLRGFCDLDTSFWLNKDLSNCQPCKESAIANNFRKMKCLH